MVPSTSSYWREMAMVVTPKADEIFETM